MRNCKRADLKDYDVIFTFRILRAGWDMDNEGWIASNKKGQRVLLMTSHGGLLDYGRNISELHEKLEETRQSAAGLKEAIKLMNESGNG